MKKTKVRPWFWTFWIVLCISSIITGAVIAITSQLGERYNTSVVEQIKMGDTPWLTIIGLSMAIAPAVITFILVEVLEGEENG